ESGPAAGARPEEANAQVARVRPGGEPLRGADEPIGEQADIEAQMARPFVDRFLLGSEQIDEQRAEAALAQDLGDVAVARAEAAAAAPMGEENDAHGALRNDEIPLQRRAVGIEPDQPFIAIGGSEWHG